MVEWLDSLISFPVEYEYLKYLILGSVVIVGVTLFFSVIASCITAIFRH